MSDPFDAIVIGFDAMGSVTVYHLAMRDVRMSAQRKPAMWMIKTGWSEGKRRRLSTGIARASVALRPHPDPLPVGEGTGAEVLCERYVQA